MQSYIHKTGSGSKTNLKFSRLCVHQTLKTHSGWEAESFSDRKKSPAAMVADLAEKLSPAMFWLGATVAGSTLAVRLFLSNTKLERLQNYTSLYATVRKFPKATVCFFFVSRYMDEKNQWGSKIKKKTQNFKKKNTRLHQPAPPCNGSASWMSSWSITKPTLHYLAPRDRCCTSLGPTYQEECEVFSSTSPLYSANLYLCINFDKAKVLHDCSFCMQPRRKGKTKTTQCVTNRAP